MFAALKSIFIAPAFQQEAHALYVKLVEWSRNRKLYTDYAVEDSLNGRFDAIVLHMFLVLERLRSEPDMVELERALAETFFSDMDRSLREMGSTDTGVGKRIKKMSQAYFGRMQAYANAKDQVALAEALKRNLYREADVSPVSLQKLMEYIAAKRIYLAAMPLSDLLSQ